MKSPVCCKGFWPRGAPLVSFRSFGSFAFFHAPVIVSVGPRSRSSHVSRLNSLAFISFLSSTRSHRPGASVGIKTPENSCIPPPISSLCNHPSSAYLSSCGLDKAVNANTHRTRRIIHCSGKCLLDLTWIFRAISPKVESEKISSVSHQLSSPPSSSGFSWLLIQIIDCQSYQFYAFGSLI